jgi:signal-transduction protein with cAMP-binding, CBS, and nucleotidyltransferase domain
MSENEIIRVRDVMSDHFNMVDGLATVSEALKTAEHIETKCFIIDKRHEDDEYGIVLLSDIAKQILARDRSPERVNIYEIMTKPVISVDPKMDIRYCARLFETFGIARAPVIENDKIIGIVGYTDIVISGLLCHMNPDIQGPCD